ncbi:hypothetical protein BDQ17DRAFT_1392755 [Cyathus striatus]|nr:hypothetical protein BDQ17DRAFT_1392755 [Cyathus striatus]
MVVIDGIVMGPTHCAYQNCSEKLANACTGGRCRIKTCYNAKEPNSQACVNHRQRQSVLGVWRIIRRTEEEGGPAWLCRLRRRNNPPHDQPNNETQESDNYFTAPQFYFVIAWTKFVKSEGAAQIMDFLEDVYPTQESRPSYVCIDKACVVLKYLINSHNWNIWKTSTRFVVDSYHYINHRVTDYLCRIYCNPSPLNGSAPNLVVVERDACEQLNAWLGGFQSILNRMIVDNFNWTLHALLFIHTQRVIQKQYKRLNQNMQTQLPGQQINEDEVEANGVEIDRVD